MQRLPEELAQAQDHAFRRARVARHERRDGVQRVEQEVRLELELEGLKLRLRELDLEPLTVARLLEVAERHALVPGGGIRGDDAGDGEKEKLRTLVEQRNAAAERGGERARHRRQASRRQEVREHRGVFHDGQHGDDGGGAGGRGNRSGREDHEVGKDHRRLERQRRRVREAVPGHDDRDRREVDDGVGQVEPARERSTTRVAHVLREGPRQGEREHREVEAVERRRELRRVAECGGRQEKEDAGPGEVQPPLGELALGIEQPASERARAGRLGGRAHASMPDEGPLIRRPASPPPRAASRTRR